MQGTNATENQSRPLGVTVLSILLGVQGLLASFFAFLIFFITLGNPIGLFGVLLAAGSAVISFFLAWGLWTIKRWALGVTIGVQVLVIVGNLLEFILMLPKNVAAETLSNLVIPVIILAYLSFNKEVRNLFKP